MKQETLVDIMMEELTQGADDSNAKCGVIGEIGCTWPLKGEGIDGTRCLRTDDGGHDVIVIL